MYRLGDLFLECHRVLHCNMAEEKKPKGILRKPGDEPREPKGEIKVQEVEGHEANTENRRNNLARKDTGGPVKKKQPGAIVSMFEFQLENNFILFLFFLLHNFLTNRKRSHRNGFNSNSHDDNNNHYDTC